MLGARLLKQVSNCTKDRDGDLWKLYCNKGNGTYATDEADCDQYFHDHNVSLRNAIVGLSSGVFSGESAFCATYMSLEPSPTSCDLLKI